MNITWGRGIWNLFCNEIVSIIFAGWWNYQVQISTTWSFLEQLCSLRACICTTILLMAWIKYCFKLWSAMWDIHAMHFCSQTSSYIVMLVLTQLRQWLSPIGYTLCFAVILSKTWRIYYIFNNPTKKKKVEVCRTTTRVSSNGGGGKLPPKPLPPQKIIIIKTHYIHSCVGKYHHSINSATAWNVM